MRIQVSNGLEALSEEAAGRIAATLGAAVAARGSAAVALAGGSTPSRLYEVLAAPPYRTQVPWAGVRVFWGDERAVPPEDRQSNYRMARETLLDHVPVRREWIHRMPADGEDLAAAARAHAEVIRAHLRAGDDGRPRFDLVLLGMGGDGHTASLFPGDPALDESRASVAAVDTPHHGLRRLTLTLAVLNAAAHVIFLVAGADKAKALRQVLVHREPLPAARVQPVSGDLTWLVDAEAARLL
jgi:6-phosphogluconolactonase